MKGSLNCTRTKKDEIDRRLLEFRGMMNETNERMFAELAFCMCTPQTKAISAWDSISTLIDNGLPFRGSVEEILPFLRKVRFCKKAKYIVEVRRKFTIDGKIQIKEFLLSFIDPLELRGGWPKMSKVLG